METGSRALPEIHTCNFMEIGEILIVVLCHKPGKKVTMISTSDDL